MTMLLDLTPGLAPLAFRSDLAQLNHGDIRRNLLRGLTLPLTGLVLVMDSLHSFILSSLMHRFTGRGSRVE